MTSEIWQFAAFVGVAAVAFVLWLNIIYLPGRTLEHRYDGGEPVRRGSADAAKSPDQTEIESEISQSSSGPTR
ncbi:hypothetical protein [Rubrobacter aplysinae]|uniref:hypothetical protein n=1 Tax=Rubrobacter aplysinae TaxID=909625 RepID=UPI00128D2A88|nr:hypothetical protein [Rubrobacter aplysinae]